jgi:hypothetical protein
MKPQDRRRFSCSSLVGFFLFVPMLGAISMDAQTDDILLDRSKHTTHTPFLSLTSVDGLSETDPMQCQVRVVGNDVVMSDKERTEVGYHVQPPGFVPDPGQWPYFAWSDTPTGVLRVKDGSGYLFFGSDGGCHRNCRGEYPRSGSFTVATGTLNGPMGEPFGNPNPPVTGFLLPTSSNLPAYIDYVGGGPVYRIPKGEPGAGNILLVYHAERPANPFWSWLGLAQSRDEGITWQDLGLIISGSPYNADGALDIGDSTLVVYTDPTTSQKYFYVYFGTDTTYLSVARASYDELLQAAMSQSPFPATGLFLKYYSGEWNQPGMNGKQSELFPGVTGETDGDSQVYWSDYRQRFIAIMDNGQYIAYGESVDGLTWPPMQVILGKSPETPVYGYANAVGLGSDPRILDDTFYSYYTEWAKGVAWQPATLNRLTITTAASQKSIVPSSVGVGSPAFALTVSGDHFVKDSTVFWNGSPRATTYVSAYQLTAQILAGDVAEAGQAQVTVSNPAPCGGISNAEAFTISSTN